MAADRHSEEWKQAQAQFNVRLTHREREHVMEAVQASGLDTKRWLLAMAEQSRGAASGIRAIPEKTKTVILDGLLEAAMLMSSMASEVMDFPEDLGPSPESDQAY